MILDIEKIEIEVAEKQMTFTGFLKSARINMRTAQRIRLGLKIQTKTAGKLAAALGVRVADIIKK